jgi:hypothetical protein
MKTQQTKSAPMNFIWGLLLGLILMGTYGFILNQNNNPEALIPPDRISLETAQKYFKKYDPGTDPNQIKSLPFSRNQILSISEILKQQTKANYFNLYRGIENKSDTIIIVVGTDIGGKENPKIIYKVQASRGRNSPCPPICDSDIMD